MKARILFALIVLAVVVGAMALAPGMRLVAATGFAEPGGDRFNLVRQANEVGKLCFNNKLIKHPERCVAALFSSQEAILGTGAQSGFYSDLVPFEVVLANQQAPASPVSGVKASPVIHVNLTDLTSPATGLVAFFGDTIDNPDIGVSDVFFHHSRFSANCGPTSATSADCTVGTFSGKLNYVWAYGTCSEDGNKNCTTSAECTGTCNAKSDANYWIIQQSAAGPNLWTMSSDGDMSWHQRGVATPLITGTIGSDANDHIAVSGGLQVVDDLNESFESGSCSGSVQGDCTLGTDVGTDKMWFVATANSVYSLPECNGQRGLFRGFINDTSGGVTLHAQSGDTFFPGGGSNISVPDHDMAECRCGLVNADEWACTVQTPA